MSGDAPRPFMTDEEIAFLAANILPTDRVWEWGAGLSTLWLAARCRHVIAVEHQASFAIEVIRRAPHNVNVLYIPPDEDYREGGDDGDLGQFRRYCEIFHGRSVDVVILDGRARVHAARYLLERAPFGPSPGLRVFLHDCQRPEYAWIHQDQEARTTQDEDGNAVMIPASRAPFDVVGRAGNLMLLTPRFNA